MRATLGGYGRFSWLDRAAWRRGAARRCGHWTGDSAVPGSTWSLTDRPCKILGTPGVTARSAQREDERRW